MKKIATLLLITAGTLFADKTVSISRFLADAGTGSDSSLILEVSGTSYTLASPDLSCEQSTEGSMKRYRITWSGTDFDLNGEKDTVAIEIGAELFSGTEYQYNESELSSVSQIGTAVSFGNDTLWSVGDDGDIDAGETVRFTHLSTELFNFDTTVSFNGFGPVELIETNGGHTHALIIGEGSSLSSTSFSSDSYALPDTYESPLVLTGAGSFYEGSREWAVNSLSFSITVEAPVALNDYSEITGGHTYYNDYPAADPSREQLYPEFSWDRVPRWLALRNSDPMTDEEVQAIADHYQLIMLEKANKQGTPTVNEGMVSLAGRLKAINPDIITLAYWNARVHYTGYSYDDEYEQNAWDWSTRRTDSLGNEQIYMFKDLYYWHNFDVPAMRDWWVNSAVDMASSDVIDGIFIDAIAKSSMESASDPVFDENWNPLTNYAKMAMDLREKLPQDKMIIANALRSAYGNGQRSHMVYLDGSYLENWAGVNNGISREDATVLTIKLMREALSKGKIINFQSSNHYSDYDESTRPTTHEELKVWNNEYLYYPLAVFLMAAEKYAYFSYQDGVDGNVRRKDSYVWNTDYMEEFNRPLGKPLGDPVQNGYQFSRSFEYLDVSVNIETKETTFNWKDPSGTEVTTKASVTQGGIVHIGEKIQLNNFAPGNYTVSLFSLNGRTLLKKKVSHGATGTGNPTISLKGVAPGVHLIRINGTEQTLTQKILIQ